jgi:ferredoxin
MAVTAVERFSVEVISTGEQFYCGKEENILRAMERSRSGLQMLHSIPVGCRGGGCGICRVRVLSGDVETKKMSVKHVTAEQQGEGFALACRVFPRGALKLELATPELEPGVSSGANTTLSNL